MYRRKGSFCIADNIDVYKRQILTVVPEIRTASESDEAESPLSVISVSYTHLDVYKRQCKG